MNKTIHRESSFELLRIICMLFIIWGHLVNKYSVQEPILGLNYLECHVIKSFTIVAVNVFVLISGYFSISFKLLRILKLGQLTWFYSVALLLLTIISGWHSFNYSDFSFLFPIFSMKYWFITTYIILYILSPCLNQLALSLSKDKFKSILLIGIFIIYIWHTMSFLLFTNRPIDDAGYGVPNFIYLYLLGRYIKLHSNILEKKQNFLLLYVITSVSLFIFQLIYSLIVGFSFTSLFSYNTIFVFFGSLSLFIFFAKREIGYNSFINNWAKYCLAVYIIHMHPLIWNKICDFIQIAYIPSEWFIPYSLLIITILYFTLAFIEKVRLYFFYEIENKINNQIMRTNIARKIENRIKLNEYSPITKNT